MHAIHDHFFFINELSLVQVILSDQSPQHLMIEFIAKFWHIMLCMLLLLGLQVLLLVW